MFGHPFTAVCASADVNRRVLFFQTADFQDAKFLELRFSAGMKGSYGREAN